MDFDPRELEADLADLLSSEDKLVQLDREQELDNDNFFADLMAQVVDIGFPIPEELVLNAGTTEERFVTYRELEELIFTDEVLPSRLYDIGWAFVNLVRAKVMAPAYMGYNHEPAIQNRDDAVGIVLASEEVDESDKDSFLALTDTYLAGLVDPFVLPTPISSGVAERLKANVGQDILNAERERLHNMEHNRAIRAAVRPVIDEVIGRRIGQHDDRDSLREAIITSAVMLLHLQKDANGRVITEEMLEIPMRYVQLAEGSSKFDMKVEELTGLVLATYETIQTLGYRP
jgi:hypothetical protein